MEGEIEGKVEGKIDDDIEDDIEIEGEIDDDIEGEMEGETLPSETKVPPNFVIFIANEASSKSWSLMAWGINRFRSLRRSMCEYTSTPTFAPTSIATLMSSLNAGL